MPTIMNSTSDCLPFWKMNQQFLDKLSKKLRISTNELNLIEPELFIDTASDGSIIQFLIFFKENADPAVLNKIEDLNYDRSVVMVPDYL